MQHKLVEHVYICGKRLHERGGGSGAENGVAGEGEKNRIDFDISRNNSAMQREFLKS